MALTKPSDKMLAEGATLTLGTKQATTSGTTKDFTSIPSGVKQIIVMFDGVSLSGSSAVEVQLGDAGGIETSGYLAAVGFVRDAATPSTSTSTAGFPVSGLAAGGAFYGQLVLTLMDAATNTWAGSLGGLNTGTGTNYAMCGGGTKSLSATLDRVRVMSANGTDTFDAGSVNIAYK